MDLSVTAPEKIATYLRLPGSKSLSARTLIIDALSQSHARIVNLAQCDDTDVLRQALHSRRSAIDVGAAGTAMRFLTAYCAVRWRQVTIDGSPRMRQRPIGVLVNALRQLGANISYTGRAGYPPVAINGGPMHGGKITVDGGVSSQFISALLMIAPVIGGLELHIAGQLVSRPYVFMTLGLMRQWGVEAEWHDKVISVPAGHYEAPASGLVTIEADWSAASYWWALQALLPDSDVGLTGLQEPHNSLQGDSRMAHIMNDLGVASNWLPDGRLRLRSDGSTYDNCQHTVIDLTDNPDLAPTLVVMLCLLGRPFSVTGLRTLRVKETDRLEALRRELRKLGYLVTIEGDDAIRWHFERTCPDEHPRIATYDDHRMAMAFAMAAVSHPGLVIENAEVVSKSYPRFWQHLAHAGFELRAL